eukprot:scaffold25182_cov62-Phaeocystis_antarctica.AAC.11
MARQVVGGLQRGLCGRDLVVLQAEAQRGEHGIVQRRRERDRALRVRIEQVGEQQKVLPAQLRVAQQPHAHARQQELRRTQHGLRRRLRHTRAAQVTRRHRAEQLQQRAHLPVLLVLRLRAHLRRAARLATLAQGRHVPRVLCDQGVARAAQLLRLLTRQPAHLGLGQVAVHLEQRHQGARIVLVGVHERGERGERGGDDVEDRLEGVQR